jgi:DNA-binding response OmpR family regulator
MARPVIALVGLHPGSGLGEHLARRGNDVREAAEDWQAEALLAAPGIDVAVIGDQIPSGAAVALLKQHGSGDGPFLIVMCRTRDLVEKVLALELGAADAVDSGISDRELAARIGRLLARRGRGGQELVVLENSTVDLKAALVMHRSGEEEQLSPGQVALIRLFAGSPRKVLTREDIMAAAPAESTEAFDRSIDSRIVRLRRKLDTESITTIRGTGYRFDPPSRATD